MTNEVTFKSSDLKWIKSVTRNKGKDWAYLELDVGDIFSLNFSKNPKWYPTNYLKPKRKELIALFQSVKGNKEYKDGWYVTHLVTPIDENIQNDNEGSHPYTRLMIVVAINSKPIPIDSIVWSFYKCNRGQICNIETVEARNKSISKIKKQEFIWSLFRDIKINLCENITSFNYNKNDIEDYEAEEGKERTILKLHKFKERDPKIIRKAKEKAKKEKRLHCEVCLFNFEIQYPDLGTGFIECHHKHPISTGNIRKTKVNDLAIVCANCHRMLHRKNKDGEYYSTSELGKIIKMKFNE